MQPFTGATRGMERRGGRTVEARALIEEAFRASMVYRLGWGAGGGGFCEIEMVFGVCLHIRELPLIKLPIISNIMEA